MTDKIGAPKGLGYRASRREPDYAGGAGCGVGPAWDKGQAGTIRTESLPFRPNAEQVLEHVVGG